MILRIILLLFFLCSNSGAEEIYIPKDHFLGISPPCPTISSAREQAFHEVAKQILRTMGGEYSIKFDSILTKSNQFEKQEMRERFQHNISGFLSDIEKNIVSTTYEKSQDGIICDMLVYLPNEKLIHLRRLSIGPKVIVSQVGDGIFVFKEVNGVSVVLTDVEITIVENRGHAKLITLFIMKVSPQECHAIKRSLQKPIELRRGISHEVDLLSNIETSPIRDTIFGTKRSFRLDLIGTDEINRPFRMTLTY